MHVLHGFSLRSLNNDGSIKVHSAPTSHQLGLVPLSPVVPHTRPRKFVGENKTGRMRQRKGESDDPTFARDFHPFSDYPTFRARTSLSDDKRQLPPLRADCMSSDRKSPPELGEARQALRGGASSGYDYAAFSPTSTQGREPDGSPRNPEASLPSPGSNRHRGEPRGNMVRLPSYKSLQRYIDDKSADDMLAHGQRDDAAAATARDPRPRIGKGDDQQAQSDPFSLPQRRSSLRSRADLCASMDKFRFARGSLPGRVGISHRGTQDLRSWYSGAYSEPGRPVMPYSRIRASPHDRSWPHDVRHRARFDGGREYGLSSSEPSRASGVQYQLNPSFSYSPSTFAPSFESSAPAQYDTRNPHVQQSPTYEQQQGRLDSPERSPVLRRHDTSMSKHRLSSSIDASAHPDFNDDTGPLAYSSDTREGLANADGDASTLPSAPGQGSFAPQRRRGKLPKHITERLKSWLLAHADHPYPTEDEKREFCSETGLDISQVSNWFVNARRRILNAQGPAASNLKTSR